MEVTPSGTVKGPDDVNTTCASSTLLDNRRTKAIDMRSIRSVLSCRSVVIGQCNLRRLHHLRTGETVRMNRPAHLPPATFFTERARPTREKPLVIMMSACLGGVGCGVDGSTNGDHTPLRSWLMRPEVRLVKFCPEDFSFGTPRMTPDSHGGNGFDVLDGKARSLAEDGTDWTEGLVKAAYEMLDRALREKVELAILMDMSWACGSTVTYLGSRFAANKVYQKGPGVAAAVLIRAGIPVISQRDERSLRLLHGLLDDNLCIEGTERDHWEKEWYQGYFAEHRQL